MEKRKNRKNKANKIKLSSSKKINKIHKPLPGLTKEKHTYPHTTKFRNERRVHYATNSTEMKRRL